MNIELELRAMRDLSPLERRGTAFAASRGPTSVQRAEGARLRERQSAQLDAMLRIRYDAGQSTVALAREYSTHPNAIRRSILRAGGKLRPANRSSRWTAALNTHIRSLYEAGRSSLDLAKLYQTNPGRILKCVRDAGGGVRSMTEACTRYQVTARFFRRIECEEAAYILGFIYADGCVRVHPSMTLTIGLNLCDYDHLVRIRDAMGANNPIYRRERSCVLAITNDALVTDLTNKSILPRKSLTAKPPKIEADLEKDFWRGVVDGDGCISNGVLHLVGTYATIQAWRRFCRRIVPESRAKIHHVRNKSWQFALSGIFALAVAERLYGGAHIALQRKVDRFEELRRHVASLKRPQRIGV